METRWFEKNKQKNNPTYITVRSNEVVFQVMCKKAYFTKLRWKHSLRIYRSHDAFSSGNRQPRGTMTQAPQSMRDFTEESGVKAPHSLVHPNCFAAQMWCFFMQWGNVSKGLNAKDITLWHWTVGLFSCSIIFLGSLVQIDRLRFGLRFVWYLIL